MLGRLLGLAAAFGLAGAASAAESPACHAGAYRLSDGQAVVISPSGQDALRYRFLDGRSGRLFPDGNGAFVSGPGWSSRAPVQVRTSFGDCASGLSRFGALGARRIAQPVIPVRFRSGDAELYGELHLPQGGRAKAAIALQYGSGRESAVTNNFVQHLLPLKGVAVLVFDKRGTGRSQGAFTMDFPDLADDLAAAARAARAMPQLKGAPLGVMGESQGGWVAPLAAMKTPVDFVVVSYGMAISAQEEDRQEVVTTLRGKGYDEAVIAQAEEVQRATSKVMNSRFTEGLDDLERLKARHAGEDWFNAGLSGDYTSLLTSLPAARIGEVKGLFNFDYDLTYDPVPTLTAIGSTPSLWVLGGADTEAPSATTLDILRRLQADGASIDIAVFPNANHGIIEVADKASGALQGRHSPGYFDLLGDWIARRKLDRPFGAAVEYPQLSTSPR